MYKNQLQELAQRSCFNLPSYSNIREGPDHAPRFKATVNFNGEIFESPNYCATLRQAEHAAAEVALNTLSRRGPSQSLAARILDETGVCKNLLQETAQRAGVSLPVYITTRTGPGHLPVFTCTVEVAGVSFTGEPAKTKKQAEKNAAMTAWHGFKQLPKQYGTMMMPPESEVTEEQEQNIIARAIARAYGKDDRYISLQQTSKASLTTSSGVPRVRLRSAPGGPARLSGQGYQYGPSESSQIQRYLQQNGIHLQPAAAYSSHSPRSRQTASSSSSSALHDSAGLCREPNRSIVPFPRVIPTQIRSIPSLGRKEKHDVPIPLDEHRRDEDEWLGLEHPKVDVDKDRHRSMPEKSPVMCGNAHRMIWSNPDSNFWSGSTIGRPNPVMPRTTAPPVQLRTVAVLGSAPPPRVQIQEIQDLKTNDPNEEKTQQFLSNLRLNSC